MTCRQDCHIDSTEIKCCTKSIVCFNRKDNPLNVMSTSKIICSFRISFKISKNNMLK